MAERGGAWAHRFVAAAVIQGGIAFALTMLLLYMELPGPLPGLSTYVRPSFVVAYGSAGAWLAVGYLCYIGFLVLGSGASALIYHYIEGLRGRLYASWLNVLAWAHLIVGNVGLGLGFGLMMYGGYIAGSAQVGTQLGGGGVTDAEIIRAQYLGPIYPFILTMLVIGAIGPLAGGIGYAYQLLHRPKSDGA